MVKTSKGRPVEITVSPEIIIEKSNIVSSNVATWAREDFGGDQARASKFLRLLGAKKAKNAASVLESAKMTKNADKVDVAEKVEAQFNRSMQYRQQGRVGFSV